jgi:hypothetical protein
LYRLRTVHGYFRHIVQPANKGKVTPIMDICGPEGFDRLRLQITRHSTHEGGKVVTLTHRPPYILVPVLEAESTPGHNEMSAATE